jgi:hypothetical protein
VIVGSGVLMLALFLIVRTSLIDDAYITFSYARNLATDLHWGVIAEQTSNTATSPLNVILLGALTALTRIGGEADAVVGAGVLAVLSAMALAWAWVRAVRALELPPLTAVLGIALVVGNPFLLSSLGLEVLLVATVLVAMLVTALEARPGWFGIAAGVALLCRVDLIVFVLAIAVGTPAIRRGWRRALAGAAIVAGPWFVFSWIAFGSAVPDTVIVKTAQRGLFGAFGYVTGPVIFFQWRWNATAAAFLPAVLGLLALVTWLTLRTAVRWGPSGGPPRIGPAAALACGGVAYYAVISLLRVPPYHWYYVPPLVSLSVFLVIAAAAWLRQARARPELRTALPAGLLALAGLLAVVNLARDVKQGVPWRAPVIATNFATADGYKRVALALRERVGDEPVEVVGEIGTLAYHCRCEILDVFSDRGHATELINDRIQATGPLRDLAYELNYLWLDRDRRRRVAAYRFIYERAPASGPDTWQVSSPWVGIGRYRLEPVTPR